MDSVTMLCQIGERLYRKNLIAGCGGNLSFRQTDGTVVITPSGVAKGFLVPGDLLTVDLEGHILSGSAKPSSEMRLHLETYRQRPDVGAIVHAHPPVSTAYTLLGRPFPDNIHTEGRGVLGTVGTVPYISPASDALANACADALKEMNVILMANHGAVTVGCDLLQAYNRMETLEATAIIYRDALLFASSIYELDAIPDRSSLQLLPED